MIWFCCHQGGDDQGGGVMCDWIKSVFSYHSPRLCLCGHSLLGRKSLLSLLLLLCLLLIVSQPIADRTGHQLRSRNSKHGNQSRGGEETGGEVFSGGGSNVHCVCLWRVGWSDGGGLVAKGCERWPFFYFDSVCSLLQIRLSQWKRRCWHAFWRRRRGFCCGRFCVACKWFVKSRYPSFGSRCIALSICSKTVSGYFARTHPVLQPPSISPTVWIVAIFT